jgi:hypothetical protein
MKPKKAKLDLSKLVHIRTQMTGKTGEKVQGVFLPFEKNDIFVGEKGLYLDLVFWPSDKIEGFDHAIKKDYSKAYREANDTSQSPFLGNALLGDAPAAAPAPETFPANDTSDNLPF